MRIENKTTYRCDGCAVETLMPHGWMSASRLVPAGQAFLMTTGAPYPLDYCGTCWEAMKAAAVTQTDREYDPNVAPCDDAPR